MSNKKPITDKITTISEANALLDYLADTCQAEFDINFDQTSWNDLRRSDPQMFISCVEDIRVKVKYATK